jgi:hypothetical protein
MRSTGSWRWLSVRIEDKQDFHQGGAIIDARPFALWRLTVAGDSCCTQPGLRASSAAALQQIAATGFAVGARDRRRADVELCCQLALRRETVTGLHDPSTTAACDASAICKKRGRRARPIAATRLANFHLVWISTGTFCLNVGEWLLSRMPQNVQSHHPRMVAAEVFSSPIRIRKISLLHATVIS